MRRLGAAQTETVLMPNFEGPPGRARAGDTCRMMHSYWRAALGFNDEQLETDEAGRHRAFGAVRGKICSLSILQNRERREGR